MINDHLFGILEHVAEAVIRENWILLEQRRAEEHTAIQRIVAVRVDRRPTSEQAK